MNVMLLEDSYLWVNSDLLISRHFGDKSSDEYIVVEMYKLCINAPVVSRKYSFSPLNSDV